MKYLVGLLCGGLMEDPEWHPSGPYMIIDADTSDNACTIYNEKTNASYFYGHCFATIDEYGNITVISDYISMYRCKQIYNQINNK